MSREKPRSCVTKPNTAPLPAVLPLTLEKSATGLTLKEEVLSLKGEALGNIEQDASMAAHPHCQ